MLENKKVKRILQLFGIVSFFWLFAHGYRFMNNLHTSDSLVSVFQDDILWQRSLGRFMQTFTMVLRGTITAPWLILGISLLFFTGAIYFMDKILNIKNTVVLVAIIGILVCNVMWTTAVACYLPWVDVYSVALFLATIGVWLYKKDTIVGYLFGSICFVACLGFYQAQIDVAFALIFVSAIMELTDAEVKVKKFFFRLMRQIICLGISGAVYYALYLTICKLHHVELAISYNSISGVGQFEGVSIPKLMVDAYVAVFQNLSNPGKLVSTILAGRYVSDVWILILRVCLILNIGILIVGLVYINLKKKTSWGARALQVLGVVTMPLALNFVYVMSKGMEYELMILSFFFLFILELLVVEKCLTLINKKKLILLAGILPVAAFIWTNIVYSNQVYFKIEMEDRAAFSLITRIVDDIESTEGYVGNSTPVVFLGNIEKTHSPVIYLQDVVVHGNLNTPFSFGRRSLATYINFYMATRMNIPSEWEEDQEIMNQLSVYPKAGSIQIIDDILYVKLSEE